MIVKLLTEHYLEFLSLKGGCTGSSESTLVKMPHCWKSHVVAHMFLEILRLCVTDRLEVVMGHRFEITIDYQFRIGKTKPTSYR